MTIGSIHFAAQVIGRAAGRSATAAAAYRSGSRIVDERTGEVSDYTRKGGVVYSEILLPEGAPASLADRSALWNAVEQSERGSRAQLAREINLALPRELTREQNTALARDYIQRTFVDAGMCADWAYHDPDDANQNPHCHVMLTMREVREDGTFAPKVSTRYLCRNADGIEATLTADDFKLAKTMGFEKVYLYKGGRQLTQSEAKAEGMHPVKDRTRKQPIQRDEKPNDWDEPTKVEEWREAYARAQNAALERAGADKRVDHRSFERRGVDLVPQVHLGATAHAMEERGERTDLGDKNRAISAINEQLRREDVPQELRQTALNVGYAIRSAHADYDDELEITVEELIRMIEDAIRDIIERVREAARAAVSRVSPTARPDAHQPPDEVADRTCGPRGGHGADGAWDLDCDEPAKADVLADIEWARSAAADINARSRGHRTRRDPER